MKYVLMFIGIILCKISAFGQVTTTTLSLYYSINQVSIGTYAKQLDSISNLCSVNSCSISIYGYADFLAGDFYNIILSEARAKTVKKYLEQKKNDSGLSIVSCKGFGEKFSEENNSKEGDPLQRRVDVIIKLLPIRKKIGTNKNVTQDVSKVELPVKPSVPSSSTIQLNKIKKGESLTIEGLNFIPGRHMLVKSAIPVLEELLEALKENPEIRIEIQGHICCLDEEIDGLDLDTQEMNLSENRALAVYNYLVRNGIDEDRLTYKGYGHTNPKVKIEKSPEDEQANRRVDIKVLED